MDSKIKVWIAVIHHRHGHDLFAAASKDGILDDVYNYVCCWWDHERVPGRPSEHKQVAVDTYFEHVTGESLDIYEREV